MQNDFEEFLQEQVRNHRIYPNDSVWREISKNLHGERTWPSLTIAAFIILSITITVCAYFTPKPNIFVVTPIASNNNSHLATTANNTLDKLKTSPSLNKHKNYELVPPGTVKANSLTNLPDVVATTKAEEANSNELKPFSSFNASEEALVAAENPFEKSKDLIADVSISDVLTKNNPTVITESSAELPSSSNLLITQNQKQANGLKKVEEVKDYNDKNMVDEFLKDHNNDVSLHTSPKTHSKSKFSYMLYIAPSISYRNLVEDHSMVKTSSNIPLGLNFVTDVNNVVRHKPGTGFEAGVSFMYNITKKVRVKTGFQFNIRQYNIEAYRSNIEMTSIALRRSNGFDTINTIAVYRNNNGNYKTQLSNRYYQLAAPIGLEWEVIGNKTVQLNVAGSIQPTYLVNRNAYLLSTNFKNYTESPEIVRSWNINTNVETFISFRSGDFKWQIGPQLRYQPYSTFISQYPIKEHLLDYGLKLGFSKSF